MAELNAKVVWDGAQSMADVEHGQVFRPSDRWRVSGMLSNQKTGTKMSVPIKAGMLNATLYVEGNKLHFRSDRNFSGWSLHANVSKT